LCEEWAARRLVVGLQRHASRCNCRRVPRLAAAALDDRRPCCRLPPLTICSIAISIALGSMAAARARRRRWEGL
jgi:hypothetical protein